MSLKSGGAREDAARVFGRVATLSRNRTFSALAPKYDFEHEFAADISKQKQRAAEQDPIERGTAAPTESMPPDEEGAERKTGEHRKYRLVIQGQGFAEQLLGKENTRRQGQRQQGESGTYDAKQKLLHRQKRGQLSRVRFRQAPMKSLL